MQPLASADEIVARVRKMVAHPITVFISASSVNSTGGELAPPRIVPTVQVEKMGGTTAALGGWRHDANAMRHWRFSVLNPWFAITFHAARLGFEAQNAAAFRFLRWVGNASRTEADEIISDTIAPPLDSTPAAIKVAPKGRRSISKSKVYKKPVRANNRRKKH
jgi:hypothetical protein